jgi:uncharacterized protein YwgA
MDRLDRIILIINDMTVKGNTRMQKYGFLIRQLYSEDLHGLNFYDDWKPYLYGPYSAELKQDLEECINQKLVAKFNTPTDSGREFMNYSLTMRGRMKLRNIVATYDIVKELYQKFTKLNQKSMTSILKDIYLAYPNYTVNSEIRETVMND